MRVFVANLMVTLGLCVLSAPGLARAQDGLAQDRVQTAAVALEGVRTLRYSGTTSVTPQATGEAVRYFTGSGEFEAPDRGHMVVEQPQLLLVTETITVGQQSWMKTTDGSAYVPLTVTYASPAPSSIAGQIREVAKYMVSPSVNDGDTQSTITADVDIARALREDSPVPGMMGLQVADTDTNVPISSSKVTITIDRATNYPLSLNTVLTISPTLPPENLPPGPLTIATSLTLSDFNSDEVTVLVPGGSQ
jgi:hypothetical protein